MNAETKTIQESTDKLNTLAHAATMELKLLQEGNKSASARARKILQELKMHSHELRKTAIDFVKILPKTKKAPATAFKKKEQEDATVTAAARSASEVVDLLAPRLTPEPQPVATQEAVTTATRSASEVVDLLVKPKRTRVKKVVEPSNDLVKSVIDNKTA